MVSSGAIYYAPTVFSYLVRYDINKGICSPENIVGDLATKWTVSTDGKTYTFTLAQGVKWHDGQAFDADDVVYTFTKILDKTRSALYGDFSVLAAVEKVDAYTVKMTLNTPRPSFMSLLTRVHSVIEAEHLKGTDTKTPSAFLIGTGPYMFKELTSGVSITYVKNPNYHRNDLQGNKLPFIDTLKQMVMVDKNAQVAAIISGQIDTTQIAGKTFESIDALNRIKNTAPNVKLIYNNTDSHTSILFNVGRGIDPIKDVRVRQAMALVVQQEATSLAGVGSADLGMLYQGLFTAAYGDSPELVKSSLGWDKPIADRIAKAQQLMKDAGYPDGFNTTLVTYTFESMQRVASYLADVWAKNLKINVTIKALSATEAYTAINIKGQFDISIGSLSGWTNDPDELINVLSTGKPGNITGYSNPKVDALFLQQSQETDPAKRNALLIQIQQLVLADVPAIPDYGMKNYIAVQPYVMGVTQMTISGLENTEQYWLNK